MENNLSAADIAAVMRGNCGFGGYGFNNFGGFGFGGDGLWLFAILALMGGGFGNWNNRGNCATTEDLASGFNFSGINNKLDNIVSAQANTNQNLSNAICQLGYQSLAESKELQGTVDSVKFDMANYAAGINATTVASNQKVLDKLSQMELANKDAIITQQNQRIAALEADARMCGIPKINTFAWGVTPFNYCNPCSSC